MIGAVVHVGACHVVRLAWRVFWVIGVALERLIQYHILKHGLGDIQDVSWDVVACFRYCHEGELPIGCAAEVAPGLRTIGGRDVVDLSIIGVEVLCLKVLGLSCQPRLYGSRTIPIVPLTCIDQYVRAVSTQLVIKPGHIVDHGIRV